MDYADKACLVAFARPDDRYWLIGDLASALVALEPDSLHPTDLYVRHLLDGLVRAGLARHVVGATYRLEDAALTRGERLERELRFGGDAERAGRWRAGAIVLDRPSALAAG